MGRSLISFSNIPLKFSHIPRSFLPLNHSNQCPFLKPGNNSLSGYQKVSVLSTKPGRKLCTKAVLSETSYQKEYPKIGAKSTGPIPPSQLIQIVETAAKTGAEVVMDAVNRPHNITYKGLTDLVT
ncbi:hypothetical protein Patl1_11888 [Pistacia atlantica]|uniref:Uncharacterized protein n=1 Tax=Pistacia atlantica TaxID=434234 RepID=A0ACC1A5P0_9ROSI|nr:hypothetical protein Patl1_11888 [Pistacia atlantica]